MLGVSARIVSHPLKRRAALPKRRVVVRASKLDVFKSLVDALLAEEILNAEVIYAEITARDCYQGSNARKVHL